MGCKVFANGNGFFHKGSGGKGIAFPDVCLSPPPSPTGPVPIPYPNIDSASNLAKGSKSVKIEGNPTGLKNKSYVSTSTGDEAGNQGGNIITHKTKGKGYFKYWSFNVKIEDKNVVGHGDPQGQNCGSDPPGGVCVSSKVVREALAKVKGKRKCNEAFDSKKHRPSITKAQRAATRKKAKQLRKNGKRKGCWQCGKWKPPFIPDHQPPIAILWYKMGCEYSEEFKREAQRPERVMPHCENCSLKQSSAMRRFNRRMKIKFSF